MYLDHKSGGTAGCGGIRHGLDVPCHTGGMAGIDNHGKVGQVMQSGNSGNIQRIAGVGLKGTDAALTENDFFVSFAHNILATNLSKEEAIKMEIDLIATYNTTGNGYNITQGGDCPEMPLEVRDKIKKALLGNKNNLGRHLSQETIDKISAAQKGKSFTEEHKRKISEAKRGKPHKPLSEESRKKIAARHKKKAVFCIETNTIYISIQECARQLDIPATTVCACCRGRIKSISGYHFHYA